MDMFTQSSAQGSYLGWMGLMFILSSLVTGFLLGWRTIDDSMQPYLLATKCAHPLYLVLGTYYWIYVKSFENFAKYVKSPSTEFLNLLFTMLVISTLALIAVDAIVLGVKLIPTAIDCYKDPPNLPLPMECDYGNEKTIYTVTVVVGACHVIVHFIILLLTITIHTGISKNYNNGNSWWRFPFYGGGGSRRTGNCRVVNQEKELLTDFESCVQPLQNVVEDVNINVNKPEKTKAFIQRIDKHDPKVPSLAERYKFK